MTPLARRIVKESCKPKSKRLRYDSRIPATELDRFGDRGRLMQRMDDVHCFDCTGVIVAANDLVSRAPKNGYGLSADFLPAPKTWIEIKHKGGMSGVLLEENRGEITATAAHTLNTNLFVSWDKEHYEPRGAEKMPDGYSEHPEAVAAFKALNSARGDLAKISLDTPHIFSNDTIAAFLALINTPKIVGRKVHQPSKLLEQRLLKARKPIGRFPMHAWTEILLDITAPPSGNGEKEGHLTGGKALHFVRSFLRVRMGKLEIVRSHWRGDASLGIKQSKYVVSASTVRGVTV